MTFLLRSHGDSYGTLYIVAVYLLFVTFASSQFTVNFNSEKVIPADGATTELFAWGIDIYENYMISSAHGHNGDIGKLYVFNKTTWGNWSEITQLHPSDSSSGKFGYSVSLYKSTIAAIAPEAIPSAVYVFQETSPNVWLETKKISNPGDGKFGPVEICEGMMVVGAPGDPGAGRVYVYSETSTGNWVQVAALLPTDAGSGTFGKNVVTSHGLIVVGSGCTGCGKLWMYRETSPNTWAEVGTAGGSLSGDGVVETDGSTVFAGAATDSGLGYQAGAVYVFSEDLSNTWTQITKLTATDTTTEDRFGCRLSVSGHILLVGAVWDDDKGFNSGSAYVFFEDSPHNWIQKFKLTASDGSADDNYASKVAMYNTWLIVASARDDNPNGADAGAFWAYDLASLNCNDGVHADDTNTTCDCSGTSTSGTVCQTPCENGGVAYSADNFNLCMCSGLAASGATCGTLCENGGISAIDDDTTNVCDCSGLHWAGKTCNKDCHNGVSEDYPSVKCNCTGAGATGNNCQVDIDDCESSPCSNGGTCSDNGVHPNEFNCSCDSGFLGRTCADTLCRSSPCLNGGSCVNGEDLVCNCTLTRAYDGTFCETEIDECDSSPCINGGTCIDLIGNYSCDCNNTGYEGSTCLQDIDDCASSPCENDGVCKDKGANKFKCDCNAFWEGTTCENNVDDCAVNACQNDALCIDSPWGNYSCNCTEGHEGHFCDMEIESCASSPCLNDGTCYHVFNSFSCECGEEYEGQVCDTYIPCLSIICENSGTCLEDVCLCQTGYIGIFCEVALVNNETDVIIFTLNFVEFTRDNDTVESILLELPTLLSAATPGTTPSDFLVLPLSSSEYSYEVTFVNTQSMDVNIVLTNIESDTELVERVGPVDVRLQDEVNEEEEEQKKPEEDMTWLIVLLVFLGVALVAGAGYGTKLYMDRRGQNNLVSFKADKLSMPV